MYNGSEQDFSFSVIPCRDFQEGQAIVTNLIQLWQPDVILVALDLPVQAMYHNQLSGFKIPYIAITPLENGPLTISWAAPLFNMDAVFFISELGKQEAQKAGVTKAEHLVIGVDTESWKPATPEQKAQLRKGLGIPDDAFVVLTVADNQERKNLSAAMEAVSLLKKEVTDRPIRYIMVTREQSPYGWRLRDLAVKFDINQEWLCFERGVPQKDLWGLYAVSDVYLQSSKAEGLGLPVLDAMAMKIPVIATRTGAMTELLEDGRGYLVPGYKFGEKDYFVDVWGNSNRVMMNIEWAKGWLVAMAKNGLDVTTLIDRALEYVKARTWDVPVKQMHEKVEEILREQKEKPRQ